MPEQHEAVKRREKFERQKLKAEHIISKSYHNKQYITVEGKDFFVIDNEEKTVYCNPRDLKIQR